MMQYAGFWRRFTAISIDSIILDIFTAILFWVGNLIVPTKSHFSYDVILPYYAMAFLLNAGYFIYFHGTTGQTPGKKMLGLKVVQLNGDPLTPGIAFLRWVGYIISKIPLFLGFIWAAFDPKKQGWHDKIAGTCVIKTAVHSDTTNEGCDNRNSETKNDHNPGGSGFTSQATEEGRADSETGPPLLS